ncbi:MAG: DNA-directed RNA polymerase subunit alpha C-terminal domain-containing protein [Bacillota bacterium]
MIDDLPQDKLLSPIEVLDLPCRPYNALKRVKIEYIWQIIDIPPMHILGIKGIGALSFDIIFDALAFYIGIPKDELLEQLQPVVVQSVSIPPEYVQFLPLPISILNLSIRAANALERSGILTIEDWMNASFKNAQKIRGIGEKLTKEIEEKVAHLVENSSQLTWEESKKSKDSRLYLIEEALESPPQLVKYIQLISKNLLHALGNERDYEILKRRYGLEGSSVYTLQEVGYYYNLTRERIRQIELRAERKIGEFILGKRQYNDSKLHDSLIYEANELVSILSQSGSILFESEIVDILQQRYNTVYKPHNLPSLRFLLQILGFTHSSYSLSKTTTGGSYLFWFLDSNFDKKTFSTAFSATYLMLKKAVLPLPFFEIAIRVNQGRKHRIPHTYLETALKICLEVEEVSDDQFQVKLEYLASLADQAYRILWKEGNPLYVRDILRSINHHLVKAGFSPSKKRSLTSQMASDPRFEPIGRSGKWSLTEWKHVRRESIVELMEEFLHFHQKPATIDEIYNYVHSKRSDVSKVSISVYLSGKTFTRVASNQYELAEWGGTPQEPIVRLTSKEVTARLISELEALFSERGTEEMPLAELVEHLVLKTKVPKPTVSSWLKRSGLVTWDEGRSPNKIAKYISGARGEREVRETVGEAIQREVEAYLSKCPGCKARVREVANHVVNVTKRSKGSFYAYLARMDNIRKEYGLDGFLYCYLEAHPNPVLSFPQIEEITDSELKHSLYRAVASMNVDDVDMGLFLLGKIFENVLRSYLFKAKEMGVFAVNKNDVGRLVAMIDCVERQGIVLKKHHLTLLREQRNERAHGEMPNLEERKRLMQYAPFLGDLYIDYILFFHQEQKKIGRS